MADYLTIKTALEDVSTGLYKAIEDEDWELVEEIRTDVVRLWSIL